MTLVNAVEPRARSLTFHDQAVAEIETRDRDRSISNDRDLVSFQHFSDDSDVEAQLIALLGRKRVYFGLKRAVDIAGAAVGLVFLFPVLLLIAIAIKLDSRGPVFFTQQRHGWMGRPFRIYKFRTFYAHHSNPVTNFETSAGDYRVTRLGRFLRRNNLDELPQLWNVLIGDMSLVGPRPAPVGITALGRPYEKIMPGFTLRHLVRPGITGLAQVRGYRGPINSEHRAQMRISSDFAYIKECSLAVDIGILMQTIVREFCRGGSGV